MSGILGQGGDVDAHDAGCLLWLVDDEDVVRRSLTIYLEKKGYTVMSFASPGDALASVGPDAGPDVLISDMVMPGMNGYQLAVQMRQAIPNLPVIFVSGYSEAPEKDQPACTRQLSKPFDLGELVRLIEEVKNEIP